MRFRRAWAISRCVRQGGTGWHDAPLVARPRAARLFVKLDNHLETIIVATYTIALADSGLQFACDADDTILRAALRAGIGLPYECNVGSCGNCKVELQSGEVLSNWPDAPALGERDIARKRVLGCQSRPLGDCSIKARVSPQYASACLPRRMRATLTATRALTHDMREFRFALPEATPFLPGQYALLYLPGVDGPRAYSMSDIAQGQASWDFIIKRTPDGAATGALFDQLEPGDSIPIDGPYGLAYLRTDVRRDIVCIAGGSGLAPLVSIARGVAATPALDGVRLHLFYGGRAARDICGGDMLRGLPGYGERFLFHPIVSMPDPADAGSWTGKVGFVHELALETIGMRLPEHEVYFAGPPAMAQAVQRMLIQEKVPQSQIHFDAFY
jgi:toluene monooxygenase electron transfer component